jgi:hypothetical protein
MTSINNDTNDKTFHGISFYKKYTKDSLNNNALAEHGIVIESYHHCIYADHNGISLFIAFVWDTREIQIVKSLTYLEWIKIRGIGNRGVCNDSNQGIIDSNNLLTCYNIEYLSIDHSKSPLRLKFGEKPKGLAKIGHKMQAYVLIKGHSVALLSDADKLICIKVKHDNSWKWITLKYRNCILYAFDFLQYYWSDIASKYDIFYEK